VKVTSEPSLKVTVNVVPDMSAFEPPPVRAVLKF
jgi:hypothetical protein